MTALSIIIDIVLILISIVLIIAVLMQEGQRQGLGAIGGGAETFFGKNASTSVEGKLKKITKIAAAVFIVLAIVATIVTAHITKDSTGTTEDQNPIVEELEDGSHVHEDGTVHDADGNVVETDDTDEAADVPADEATEEPVDEAAEEPADEPTEEPAAEPTEEPADEPTEEPEAEPTAED